MTRFVLSISNSVFEFDLHSLLTTWKLNLCKNRVTVNCDRNLDIRSDSYIPFLRPATTSTIKATSRIGKFNQSSEPRL